MSHRDAPLTPQGRLLLCRRIEAGTPIAHVAEAMSSSRQCASKWWRWYRELGVDGLHDRSSRPLHSPTRTPPRTEEKSSGQRPLHRVAHVHAIEYGDLAGPDTGLRDACGKIRRLVLRYKEAKRQLAREFSRDRRN